MDLVRQILLEIESHEHGYAPDYIEIEGCTEEKIAYHCYLLGDAGLLNVADNSAVGDSSPGAIPINLTWEGHEFIANAQNESVWNQAKSSVSKLGDVSFSVWASVLSQVVMNNLGINS